MTPSSRLVARTLSLVVAAGALTLVSPAAHAADPVAGAQTSGDTQFPHVGNGGYDVSHYDLDIVWTPQTIPVLAPQTIDASATITATTTGAPLSSFSLDFEGLTVDSVTVNGTPATFTRSQVPAETRFKLVITPTTPVDGEFTTVVEYSGTPVAHEDADGSMEGWNATSDGATFVNQPIGSMTGFPNNNTPADKATYDFSIDIPSTISLGDSAAVANGELVSHVEDAGRTTWVWEQQEQMASELVIISIGRYDMTTADIALASGRTIPEWTFIDPTATGASAAATARGNLKGYLDFFEARYGPYPGNSTGIVVDSISPLAGINYALETQDRSFFPNSVGTATLIHEVMHQWFGNNVSPKVWNDLWLGEGPATYAEEQYVDEAGTEEHFYDEWVDTPADDATWTTPTVDEDDSDPTDLYGSHVYDRGAMALEALRTAIGAPTFAGLMREWQVRYAGQSPGTAAFVALAEELSGRQLDAFFQDWIYDADKPAWPGRFDLALASTPAGGPVSAGAGVTYRLSVTNTGQVPLAGTVVTADLTDVLDDATLGALPSGATRAGGTLTWTVPSTAVGATTVVQVPVTVAPGSGNGVLRATTRAATLGSTCTTCASTLAVRAVPVSPAPRPGIRGRAEIGRQLRVVPGQWQAGAVLTYQWFANRKAIRGATGTKLKLRNRFEGQRIKVKVTGTRPGYLPVTRVSKRTARVI
ncbi:M1 family aminopeptidase [Nocardioides sp.]|uniref:M1 family aminopeptidase n=1 Tax=Nocardioides sp. TaxID=35761 RepID=UPI001A345A5D|nr:M1 family aminopeptidase [Nocardioides sp.]MBJ7356700.1 M1 family metallopeptidase [Nocardioides sp.]